VIFWAGLIVWPPCKCVPVIDRCGVTAAEVSGAGWAATDASSADWLRPGFTSCVQRVADRRRQVWNHTSPDRRYGSSFGDTLTYCFAHLGGKQLFNWSCICKLSPIWLFEHITSATDTFHPQKDGKWVSTLWLSSNTNGNGRMFGL